MEIQKNLNLQDLENETWKIIENYPYYMVSNLGRIKSLKFKKEKILKQCKNKRGYFIINLWKNKKSKTKYIQVLLFEIFNDYKLKPNECIHHKDENKENNNFDNLEKMTKFEHLSFHAKGEGSPNNKLKNEEVWLIKKILNSDYYKSGKITQEFIGKMFMITVGTVSLIKSGKIWSHIKLED